MQSYRIQHNLALVSVRASKYCRKTNVKSLQSVVLENEVLYISRKEQTMPQSFQVPVRKVIYRLVFVDCSVKCEGTTIYCHISCSI